MAHVEKTVFLSYRRTNYWGALAIVQNLTQNGYDVFFDFTGMAPGDFESIILENIRSRAHFLVLLTPSALERCDEPGDWLRREIETALDTRRNIVPLMLEGFDFKSPAIAKQLTGKLALLQRYAALSVPAEFFAEAMDKLRRRFLNVPLDAVLHPASPTAQEAAKGQKAAADTAPAVSEQELTAQGWFEKGFETDDPEEKLKFYGRAIRLNPNYAVAFYNRGIARQDKGDLDGALRDYNEAIRLRPDDSDFYMNRGLVRQDKGDIKGALEDFNEAIRLNPLDPEGYVNRANARSLKKSQMKDAIRDYDEAIRLKPDYADAFYNRADARYEQSDLTGALQDYDEAIRLSPDYSEAFNNRGLVREEKGDVEGAFQDYSLAISFNSEYTDPLYNRALIFQQRNNYLAAIADFQKYLDNGGGVNDGDQREVEGIIRALKKKLGATAGTRSRPAKNRRKPARKARR
ncbi:MAG: tetratricopeptide repeat protein [Candidatus Angelobacter sp.]